MKYFIAASLGALWGVMLTLGLLAYRVPSPVNPGPVPPGARVVIYRTSCPTCKGVGRNCPTCLGRKEIYREYPEPIPIGDTK